MKNRCFLGRHQIPGQMMLVSLLLVVVVRLLAILMFRRQDLTARISVCSAPSALPRPLMQQQGNHNP